MIAGTNSNGQMDSEDRHAREIRLNRGWWGKKSTLRRAYLLFHQKIRDNLSNQPGKKIVEIGSGIGSIKEVIPECVTTDLFPNPWLDQQENAYTLSFPSASVGNLILFDVWHHLEYPGTAMNEFSRVLAPRGRLIIFEPAMSLVGRIAFSLFHKEPLNLKTPITWNAPDEFVPTLSPYFAAQSLASRIFLWKEIDEWSQNWTLVYTQNIVSFSYLLSGGFSGPNLYPPACQTFIESIDRILEAFPKIFAARLLIVLEKKNL